MEKGTKGQRHGGTKKGKRQGGKEKGTEGQRHGGTKRKAKRNEKRKLENKFEEKAQRHKGTN